MVAETEWISGDNELDMLWSGSSDGPFTLLQATLKTPGSFQEVKSRAQDGVVYYAMKNVRRSM